MVVTTMTTIIFRIIDDRLERVSVWRYPNKRPLRAVSRFFTRSVSVYEVALIAYQYVFSTPFHIVNVKRHIWNRWNQ